MADYTTDASAESYGHLITLATADVTPPTDAYIGPDDTLVVQCWNSQASQRLLVHVRLLLPDGSISFNQYSYVPTTDRILNSFAQHLSEGFLLSVTATTITTTPRAGSFVRVSLIKGWPVSPVVGEILMAGYVGTLPWLSWPPGVLREQGDGRGLIREISGTIPAAGAEISEAVPSNARWHVMGFLYQLVTSAAVANRVSQLCINPGGGSVIVASPAVVQAASTTVSYSWAEGIANSAVNPLLLSGALPENVTILGGGSIQTRTQGIQPGDQYSAVLYMVEEWIEA
jgi:hypothetical protein